MTVRPPKEHREAEHCMDDIDEAANLRLKAKVSNLESCSHRLNGRIVGIKEDTENGRPTEFVSLLLPELLGRDNFTKPVIIDQAHCRLRPKPLTNKRPRIIIAGIHNDGELVRILWLSREQAPQQYHSERVSIFPDTARTPAQCQTFNAVRKKLIDAGAKCTLRFPAELLVVYNNSVKVFDSPADAERFGVSLSDQS